jgi:hypothetical protein
MFFWHQRNRRDALRWHALMWLPLALMFYAHRQHGRGRTPTSGGVEAIRWFILGLLLWLGLNTLSRERLPLLFWGIHWGGGGGVAVDGAAVLDRFQVLSRRGRIRLRPSSTATSSPNSWSARCRSRPCSLRG